MIDDRNTEAGKLLGYKDIVRENAVFEEYYRAQKICPEEEFPRMMEVLKSDLPSSFRITGSRSQAKALLKIIEGQYFKEILDFEAKGGKVVKPEVLPWYPDQLAYQLNLTRKDIRREELYFKLHNFLVAESETGNVTRQEAVSMIPPLVLDVKPHHKVLDMCAAPGSKTTQLIEALHMEEGTLPTGFVVANDANNARCYMLTHQAKRLQSPSVLITNHDAAIMPNFLVRPDPLDRESSAPLVPLRFDRILCDVPCSGDGTMRKNPDIWPKWNAASGSNLHGVQYRILKRGIELLDIGGRLVYSTCSLNPVEDESVIQRLLKDAAGTVNLVDISNLLPGLKYSRGVTSWKVSGREGEMYETFDGVPEHLHTQLRAHLFPSSPEEVKQYNLDRCIRVLPHHQNTGGFFVALLEKSALCPWEAVAKAAAAAAAQQKDEGEDGSSPAGPPPAKVFEPCQKKRKFFGFREDPFVYIKKDDPVYKEIQEYFGLTIPGACFLTRSREEAKRTTNLYFTTLQVRNLVENNLERIKIINTGVKAFTRCENKGAECDFRIAQEGALSVIPFITSRILHPTRSDLEVMLQSSDFEKPPENGGMSAQFIQELEDCSTGSVAFVYEEKGEGQNEAAYKVEIVGWKGKSTVRSYVPRNERLHYLRLIGGDISKYETNKFEEKEKRKRLAAATADAADEKNGEESEAKRSRREDGEEDEEGPEAEDGGVVKEAEKEEDEERLGEDEKEEEDGGHGAEGEGKKVDEDPELVEEKKS